MKENFSDYIQSYFLVYLPTTRNLSHNKIMTYKNSVLDFINYIKKIKNINELKINDITIDIIENFIKYLQEKGNAPQTINLKLSTLKSFFSYIEIRGIENYNICMKIKNIKPLKSQKKLPEYLTADEIKALLKMFDMSDEKDLKELTIITIMYDCALRVSELCNLKIEDIKINTSEYSTIKINNSKNNKSRILPITKNTKNILKLYIKKNITDINQSLLFVNHYNKQYTRKGIRDIIVKRINNARKINKDMYKGKIGTHIFRHSKAMHMLEAGNDIITIRDFLGHSSIKTTEIYARISTDKLKEILENNIKTYNIKIKRTKEEQNKLENWLKNIKY